MPTSTLQDLLARAADMLLSDAPPLDGEVREILAALTYSAVSTDDVGLAERHHRSRLLRMASRFERLFQLAPVEAPGLTFFGAELAAPPGGPQDAARASASGAGLTLQSAFQSCVGEGAEFLSQFERDTDVRTRHRTASAQNAPADVSALLTAMQQDGRELDWVVATRVHDGAQAHLPADICLRRRPKDRTFDPPFLLGVGCAAGPSRDAAVLHGLLELIERDAVALWWRGGRRGRLVRAEDRNRVEQGLLDRIRRPKSDRRTWYLDITSDLGVPCIVAISTDAAGKGLAFGFAARMSTAQAFAAAVIEMCQMELAYAVIDAKLSEVGEAALNERDRAHLHRREHLDASACAMLQPAGAPSLASRRTQSATSEDLRELAAVLSGAGVGAYVVDLTRPEYGIPVVRVLAPALQVEPSPILTTRLVATLAETGGPDPCSEAIPLM